LDKNILYKKLFRRSLIVVLFIVIVSIPVPRLYSADYPVFEAESSYNYLLKQCSFGPRNPGSKGHDECLQYLNSELKKYAVSVSLQQFAHQDTRLKRDFTLTNIIADFGPQSGDKIILCAHWDCRPRADREKNPADRDKPIPGANDGASGVAVLLEMARLFGLKSPDVPVQIVLFDGEDYGHESEIWDYLLGSKYFARNADAGEYKYAVLLDMIGDADLEIKREYNSYQNCKSLQDKIWKIASKTSPGYFSNRISFPITDDHLPLQEIGIPAVDLIDFDYPYWHTLQDTPDKCSKSSLEAVGKVLVELIYGETN